VPTCEYNPIAAVQTNIIGTRTVIEACIAENVKRAVFLSTDKAVLPINLYGATKMVAERLWLDACFYKPIFSVVRYGNVMGSKGSVLELYRKLGGYETLPLTHHDMTRFWTTFEQAIQIIELAMVSPVQTVYIPNSPAFKMHDLILALDKRATLVDMRPGEKLYETLIHEYELSRASFFDDHYRIQPEIPWDNAIKPVTGMSVLRPLTSDKVQLTVDEIRKLCEGG